MIENSDAIAKRSLRLSYGGSDNKITLYGADLPNGVIHLIGDGAICNVSSSNIDINLWLNTNATCHIGARSIIFGLNAYVYDDTTLSIGEDCLFATQINIWTSDNHSIIDLATDKQMNFPASVTIEDHVWISEGVTILKGVKVGKGSVLANRALVNASIPQTELWGGVPARRLKTNVSWVASHPANPHDVGVMRSRLGIEGRPEILPAKTPWYRDFGRRLREWMPL